MMKSIAETNYRWLVLTMMVLLMPGITAAAAKLTVISSGTGSGTIISFPAGINCGNTCHFLFKKNAKVTLTALPDPGSTFVGWSGACRGAESTCRLKVKKAKTVTANFAATLVPLTITRSGSGTGTITSSPAGLNCGSICSTTFSQTHEVTLTAQTETGSLFNGWSGACSGMDTTCTITMDQAQSVNADFNLSKIALSIRKFGSGSGLVSSFPSGIDCGGACIFDFDTNTVVNLTATPVQGSTFEGWLGACSDTNPSCTLTLNQAQNLYAKFSAPSITTYHYDANGNITQITDPSGNIRQFQYDNLNQLIRQLEPNPSVIGSTSGQIDIEYDLLGQVARLIDPRNVTTDYQLDGFGNVLSQSSPDTGLSLNTYDEAGNLKTHTDARGKTATHSYDSQNRLIQAVYDDQTLTYGWDTCNNGIGRLCGFATDHASQDFSYDEHGRISDSSQTVGAVMLNFTYRYNSTGQLQQTTLPSGHVIRYSWQHDRMETIQLNGQTLISQIDYEPDGQIRRWIWNNGTTSERHYDLAGRPVVITLGNEEQSALPAARHYHYDAASRVIGMVDEQDPRLDRIYQYDGLERLISDQHGALTINQFDYAYDLSGNRISRIQNNTRIETHGIDPASNRLQQKTTLQQTLNYSYDAAGHLIGDGTFSYGYNADGRLISATGPNLVARYSYNALGQRVSKTVNGITRLFAYDEQGHLAGEYDDAGHSLQEIIWLDDLPVALLKPADPQGSIIELYYIHSDHLATPRKITRSIDNRVVWTWESEAFGASQPNQNPSGLGEFVFNLRFPGQYYDPETGLFYNLNRDYDPENGRYIESDPIGLAGGINTYAYVNGNPINRTDPLGLSDLIYNNNTKTLTVINGSGSVVDVFPAGNNAQRNSRGPWETGIFNYAYHTTHPDDSPDSSYGSNGNFIFNVPGCIGCGVHSGRTNKKDRAGRSGTEFATKGCIRTTDDATSLIQQLIERGDSLKTLKVVR